MKCKAKSRRAQAPEKAKPTAPKIRSTGYWVRIVVLAFFAPLMFTGVGVGILLFAIAKKFFFLTFLISPVVAFYIARKTHQEMLSLSEEEYEKRFDVPFDWAAHNREVERRENDPFNPMSANYWIIGPGSDK